MAAPTDYFEEYLGAVKTALKEAFEDGGVLIEVYAQKFLRPELIDKPGVIVTFGGSEGQNQGGTNRRDFYLYPFGVFLYTATPDRDEDADGPAGCSPTLFREIVRRRFGNRRGVTPVASSDAWMTQYEAQPPVYDPNSPGLDQLSSACGVSVYATVPRGF